MLVYYVFIYCIYHHTAYLLFTKNDVYIPELASIKKKTEKKQVNQILGTRL